MSLTWHSSVFGHKENFNRNNMRRHVTKQLRPSARSPNFGKLRLQTLFEFVAYLPFTKLRTTFHWQGCGRQGLRRT